MAYLFEDRLRILRIAILMSYKNGGCSYHYHSSIPSVLNLGSTAGHGVQTLQIFHGFDPAVAKGSALTWPGCKGLKEVFWVVHSPSWETKSRHIGDSAGFRSYEHCVTCGKRGFPPIPSCLGGVSFVGSK